MKTSRVSLLTIPFGDSVSSRSTPAPSGSEERGNGRFDGPKAIIAEEVELKSLRRWLWNPAPVAECDRRYRAPGRGSVWKNTTGQPRSPEIDNRGPGWVKMARAGTNPPTVWKGRPAWFSATSRRV